MNHGFLTFLANFMHFFLYKGRKLSIFVREHRRVSGIRYVVETLFIILDRYVKLYIYLTMFKLYI